MEVICEICNTKCFLVDGDYICQEGHVSKYVQEMAEEAENLKVHRTLRKQKTENMFLDLGPSYKKILIYNLVFYCLAEPLGIADEKYFHYYVNFLSGDRKKVYYDIDADYTVLCVLLYLSKLEMAQKEDELIFYNTFIDELRKIKLDERNKYFKKLLLIKHFPITGLQISKHVYNFKTKRAIVDTLGLEGHAINKIENKLYFETGLKNPLVEYNKLLFRNNLRCELSYMLNYFKHLTNLFCITLTSEMVFYFEKYVYMREYDKLIGLPEDEVCFFLFLFDKHNAIDFDFKKAYKNVYTAKQRTIPKEESLVNILVVFLRTTVSVFHEEVQLMLFRSGCNGHSRFFMGSFFQRKFRREIQFQSIKMYLKKLKVLLKTKKNLKLKKEYVENNMI